MSVTFDQGPFVGHHAGGEKKVGIHGETCPTTTFEVVPTLNIHGQISLAGSIEHLHLSEIGIDESSVRALPSKKQIQRRHPYF